MKRIFQISLLCLIVLLLVSCVSSNISTNPSLNTVLDAWIGTPSELVLYSELYFRQNEKWPTNYNELKSFANQNSIQTNKVPPLAYCHAADFVILTNNNLQIRYITSVRTNFLSTNTLTISPITKTNGTNNFEIQEIDLSGSDILLMKDKNSGK